MTFPSFSERYVHETLRHVPAAQRDDVGRELHGLIGDMIDAKVAAGSEPAAAERAALLELGEPERLAASYAGRQLVLIGPALYPTWRRVTTIAIAALVPLVVLGVVIAGIADERTVGPILGDVVGAAFSTAVQLAFWITLAFAISERTSASASFTEEWKPESLPPSPGPRQIGASDLATSIVGLGVTIGFFVWQQLQRIGGVGVPMLDPELWTLWIPVLIGLLVAQLVLEVAVYRRRRWSASLASLNAALGIAFAAPLLWLTLTDKLLNPELPAATGWPDSTFDTISLGVAISVVIITAIEIGDAAWKARQALQRPVTADV